jgi:retinol dehydrogenase-12
LPPSSPTVIVNAVNPGYCYSTLRRNLPFLTAVPYWVMDKALPFTTEVGSRQLVYAAVGGDDAAMRGAYVSYSEVSDYVLSDEGAKRIWVRPSLDGRAMVQLKFVDHVG